PPSVGTRGDFLSRRDKPQGSHRGMGGGMSAQGDPTQHGKPSSAGYVTPTDNPRGPGRALEGGGEARTSVEGRECRGGKGASVQGQRPKGHESQEIGDEPTTSRDGSETPDGAAHQSEGVARLSVLCSVRQGVPKGRAGVGLRALPC